MILAGLLGGASKGIGRDLGMGFGVTERDQDYFDRTRETLRRQYGDRRAELYMSNRQPLKELRPREVELKIQNDPKRAYFQQLLAT